MSHSGGGVKKVVELKGGVFLFNGFVSNPYLINGDKLVVVDPATPSAAELMIAFVERELNRDRRDIALVTATHFHIDHIGGIDLLKGMTGAQLALHPLVGEYLSGRRIKFPPCRRWLRGIIHAWRSQSFALPSLKDLARSPLAGYPLLPNRLASPVDIWLSDSRPLQTNAAWKVLFTPGHVEDSICLYHAVAEIIITGDTVLNVSGSGELNPFYNDEKALLASFERLKELRVTSLYPAHGRPLEKEDLWDGVRVI